jgi:hypothetical protein
MKRIARFFLWTILFLVLLVGVDQFILRFPSKAPVLTEIREIYFDFRSRLLRLVRSERGTTVESVIEQTGGKKPPSSDPEKCSARYLYVDQKGELQFADTLEEIPPHCRKKAQKLDRSDM